MEMAKINISVVAMAKIGKDIQWNKQIKTQNNNPICAAIFLVPAFTNKGFKGTIFNEYVNKLHIGLYFMPKITRIKKSKVIKYIGI